MLKFRFKNIQHDLRFKFLPKKFQTKTVKLRFEGAEKKLCADAASFATCSGLHALASTFRPLLFTSQIGFG
jgi:hypothetical protein